VIYLDTSAVVKLIRREADSDALLDWLGWQPQLVTSAVIDIELPRALSRTSPDLLADIPRIMSRIHRYEVVELVRQAACGFPACAVAEAIHLATATAVFFPLLTAFVSYDEHQLEQARAAGLPTHTPRAACRRP